MVTLQKYLYGPWKPNGASAEEETVQPWVDLVLGIMDGMDEYVLNATADVDLRENLRSIRTAFQAATEAPELSRAGDQLSMLIKSYRARVDQTARSQSQDLYRILTTLNEALLLLAAMGCQEGQGFLFS